MDGTFSKCPGFKHIILVTVTCDGNNNLVFLLAGVVDKEDQDNWCWFHEHPQEDFPGFTVLMSDADKGITSEAFSLSQTEADVLASHCTKHTSDNCQESAKCSMNEGHELLINRLAHSRTEDICRLRLAEARSVHKEWADWSDQRKCKFVAFAFLNRDVPRWGKVTGNAAENIDSAILDARQMPILFMTLAIVGKMQSIHRR